MTATATETLTSQLLELPLGQLHPSNDNPRRDVGDVTELAKSIQAMGILEPLIVSPNGSGYVIVAGHRRFAGAIAAGLVTAPCIVRELDDQERLAAMLVENLQRADLAPLEEAGAYRRLVEEFGLSQRILADRVGRSQGHISKRLTLLELPAAARKELDAGGITIDDAIAFAKIADPKSRDRVWKQRGQVHGGIRRAIDEELDRQNAAIANARVRGELETNGLRVLEFKIGRNAWDISWPTGAIEIEKGATLGRELDLDPAKHESEPCHAVAIHPRSGNVIPFCTDRKRHPNAKTGDEKHATRRSGDDAKWKAHEKELRVARDARRTFVRELLSRKIPTANELIIGALIERSESEARKIACQILDLEPVKITRPYKRDDYELPLRELAAKNTASNTKVGLTLAFAASEMHANAGWSSWSDRVKRYVAFLAENGYIITPAEKREISGKRPSRRGY